MKKAILCVSLTFLSACATVSAFDGNYGGYARLQSLGGIYSALPDRYSIMDLYSAGFNSAILLRGYQSYAALAPSLVLGTWDAGAGEHDLKSFGMTEENANIGGIGDGP